MQIRNIHKHSFEIALSTFKDVFVIVGSLRGDLGELRGFAFFSFPCGLAGLAAWLLAGGWLADPLFTTQQVRSNSNKLDPNLIATIQTP